MDPERDSLKEGRTGEQGKMLEGHAIYRHYTETSFGFLLISICGWFVVVVFHEEAEILEFALSILLATICSISMILFDPGIIHITENGTIQVPKRRYRRFREGNEEFSISKVKQITFQLFMFCDYEFLMEDGQTVKMGIGTHINKDFREKLRELLGDKWDEIYKET